MVFLAFKDYGVLGIWELCDFEDLRIMVFWRFEDNGV